MIVSHKHEFIFIHVPRTGGSAVREALIPFAGVDPFWHSKEIPQIGPGRHDMAHILARDWRYFPLLSKNRHFFIFAVKRNPYKRFVSAYFQGFEFMEKKNRSFDWLQEDINARMPDTLRELRRAGHRVNTIHLVPQTDFIFDGRKCLADIVIRQESLIEDLKVISSISGIEISIKKRNVTPLKEQPLILSQSLVDEINLTYKDDFSRLAYDRLVFPT